MSRRKRNLELRKFWQAHLDAWALTGLSQAAYCRDNLLKVHQFTYWKKKLCREALPVEFVEFSKEALIPQITQHDPLRLSISSRFTIEVPDRFNGETLERVLMILEKVR